jgi:hypothetical protein
MVLSCLIKGASNDTNFNRDGHETFLVQTINILSEGRINMLISDRTHCSLNIA